MVIKGKVYCFFEQSGTFKNEFIKLGSPAEDYDIQNNFGQTDHVVNLFGEIEKCYAGGGSLFDDITKDDLIVCWDFDNGKLTFIEPLWIMKPTMVDKYYLLIHIYMETRKMVLTKLFAGQESKPRHREKTCGHSRVRRGWAGLRE